MKLTISILNKFLLTSLLFLFLSVPALAFEATSADTVTLDVGQSKVGTYVVSGESISINGLVDGDLICAGKDIKITGKVTGDIICAGQTIDISGIVSRNLYTAGQTITLAQTASISGEALIAAQKATLLGVITRDLNLFSQDVTRDSLKVLGKTVITTAPATKDFNDGFKSFASAINVVRIITIYFAGLLFLLIAPHFFDRAETELKTRAKYSLVSGTVILLLGLISASLMIFMVLTIIGIPIAFMLYMFFSLYLIMSQVVVALFLGHLFFATANRSLAFTLGLLILSLLGQAPVIGELVALVVTIAGMGALYQAWHTSK